ncbi:MAG: glycerol-3-phosphate acyltransferase [Dehalococcoidaceae bacterium]|nr:glycerol-3-phosphate acyltransferase [Dehalococcoidaceae bacterium]
MLIWTFILLAAGAYLLGSIPAAYIAARLATGKDIRKEGSGNVGASNVARSASKKLALSVFLFDIAKGYLVVWLAGICGLALFFQILVGVIAVAGHNWPVFLKFNGGRGIATSLGVVLAVSPWLGLIAMVVAYGLAPFKQLAVGVLIALISLPVLSWFFASPLGIEDKFGAVYGFIVILALAVFRRLAQRRLEISRDTPVGELFFNRLVFDRDIRSREDWLNRKV